MAAVWLVWSTMLFLRICRDANVVSAHDVITAALTLAVGWFILRACRGQQRVRG